jgi:hypothetical protein
MRANRVTLENRPISRKDVPLPRSQSTFAKRDREQKRKERAQAKEARRAARRNDTTVRVGKGPPIEANVPDANTTSVPAPPPPVTPPPKPAPVAPQAKPGSAQVKPGGSPQVKLE